MGGAAERRLGAYSKGMRQKVGLIRAMLHDPAVLLLDEPTSAMDPHSAKLVRDAIRKLRRDRRSIILCTHNLPEAEMLADRIAIINQGQIVAQGTPAELKRRLLGHPILEIRLDRPLNGELDGVNDLIAVERAEGNVIRYRTPHPVQTNPQLVQRLTGMGLGVVSLREIPQSLEDVYLNVVEGAEPPSGDETEVYSTSTTQLAPPLRSPRPSHGPHRHAAGSARLFSRLAHHHPHRSPYSLLSPVDELHCQSSPELRLRLWG